MAVLSNRRRRVQQAAAQGPGTFGVGVHRGVGKLALQRGMLAREISQPVEHRNPSQPPAGGPGREAAGPASAAIALRPAGPAY